MIAQPRDELHESIRSNDRERIRSLVQRRVVQLNTTLQDTSQSPLCYACECADQKTVTCLLELGADPNYAMYHCFLPVVAAANRYLPDGATADGIAIDIMQLLIRYGAEVHTYRLPEFPHYVSPFFIAIKRGRMGLVELLLEHGFVPGSFHEEWWTPLCLAAAYGQAGTVRLLLARGADSNGKRKDGRTPLHAAVVHNLECDPDETVGDEAHLAVIRELLGQRADACEGDGKETILESAQRRANEEMIAVIMKASMAV
jgi:ankyrin repeat protein